MTDFDLLTLIGEADDQYIMDSRRRPKKKSKKNTWTYVLAACLALVVIGSAGAVMLRRGASDQSVAAQGTGSVMEAAKEDAAAEEALVMEETMDAAPAEEDAAAEEAADAGLPGATLLAMASYPEPIGEEDYEAASENWVNNQTSDETKTALNAFAYSTAARILANNTASGCYSPLSLYQTLAILASGSQGQTRDQLLSLLGQSDLSTLADQTGKLYRVNYADNDVNILKISNSLWLDETDSSGAPVDYHQDWVMSAAADYYAEVYAAEFESQDTAVALGTWIAQKTGGMLSPSPEVLGFDPNTVMAIVNTLWYKTQWADKFYEDNTESAEFTTGSGQKVTCDFMHRTDVGGSAIVTEEYTKSALPLNRGRMIVVLPQEGVSVDDLLTEEKLWEIFENGDYEGADVVWSVPKFETSATYQLEDTLEALGVTDAFQRDQADFGLISDTPLYVGQVQQGTHIAVNEDGVEAASYSMAAMMAGAAAPEELPTVEMNLNRPFIYLITADDGSTLFIGVVRDPAA